MIFLIVIHELYDPVISSRKIIAYSFLSNWAQLIHPSGCIYAIVSVDHDNGPNLGKTQQSILTDIPANVSS